MAIALYLIVNAMHKVSTFLERHQHFWKRTAVSTQMDLMGKKSKGNRSPLHFSCVSIESWSEIK